MWPSAAGVCKVKPVLVCISETLKVFSRFIEIKNNLCVSWRARYGGEVLVTRSILNDGMNEIFRPSVKKKS